MALGEGKEISVGHLTMTYQREACEGSCFGWRNIVGPELMTRHRDYLGQQRQRLPWADRVRDNLRVSRDADERELREWAGRPSLAPDFAEPRVGLCMMNVLRPRQRDERSEERRVGK